MQISGAHKEMADNLVQQLIAKGYDGYVVQTEVKGQTDYRVRSPARETAEQCDSRSTRQEGYHRDAYLTGD